MNLMMDESSTRRSIINLLKRSNGMTIDELSRQVNITPMGIRQHLLSLEKKGIVRYITQKHGIGRPGFVYMLTEKARSLFPTAYDQLALDMIREVKKLDGSVKIEHVVDSRRKRLLASCKEAIAGCESRKDAIQKVKAVLEAEGHIIEVSRENGHYHFSNFHCPVMLVASEFREICKNDLKVMQELFGSGVMMDQNIIQGDIACRYIIPAH